jgi:predicted RNase H-like HicB family nuclease
VVDVKDAYTAVIKKSGDWWIGWIEEVPGVNCQETSKEELLETLRATLREALEFNRHEALEAAGDEFAYSGANWTLIPAQTDHPFRSKLDTDSGPN